MKVESITTPGFQHSKLSSLVEIILLIQEGPLGPYPWRQNPTDPTLRIQKKWRSVSSVVKKIKQGRGVSEEELLPIAIEKPDLFQWSKVGLLFWHIDNKPVDRGRFAEVIESMIKTHRVEALQTEKVPKKTLSLKNLARKKTNEQRG